MNTVEPQKVILRKKISVEQKLKPVKFLNLYFPNGATVDECQKIAQQAEELVDSRIDSGGFSQKTIHMEDGWVDDSMIFSFGHAKNPTTIRVPVLGSVK